MTAELGRNKGSIMNDSEKGRRFEVEIGQNATFFEKSTILIGFSLDKRGKKVYSNCIR